MAPIISVSQIAKIVQSIKKRQKSIVLVGGCFDVLHPGHVIFLEKAKAAGDYLIVLLESDQKIKQLKGVNRPVHNQKERAKVLAALRPVDLVVVIPMMEDKDYDQLISKIKPDVIAATLGYGDLSHHQRSARSVGAELKYVTKMISRYSTSQILKK